MSDESRNRARQEALEAYVQELDDTVTEPWQLWERISEQIAADEPRVTQRQLHPAWTRVGVTTVILSLAAIVGFYSASCSMFDF